MNITDKTLLERLRRVFLTALIACTLGFVGSLLAGGEDAAIIAAANKFVAANSVPMEFKVWVEKVKGDYARAKVTPKDAGATDPAWIFLKREKGVWHGLTMGTAFMAEDYKQMHIPASLQL